MSIISYNEKLRLIVKTGKNGNVIIGRKSNLVNDMRFSLNNRSFYSSIQSATLVGDENVCVQSLFHIVKSGYNIFKSGADWVFINLCTTGHVHFSRWSVGLVLTEDKQKQLWIMNGIQDK